VDYAKVFSDKVVSDAIHGLSEEDLKLYPEIPVISEVKISSRKLFEEKANELWPRVFQLNAEQIDVFLQVLNNFIDDVAREHVLCACIRCFSEKSEALGEGLERSVRARVRKIATKDVISYNFSGLVMSVQEETEALLLNQASALNPQLCQRVEFRDFVCGLKSRITKLVKLLENEIKREYAQYEKAETEKRIAEAKNNMQSDIQPMMIDILRQQAKDVEQIKKILEDFRRRPVEVTGSMKIESDQPVPL
jgi:hypothetical protein